MPRTLGTPNDDDIARCGMSRNEVAEALGVTHQCEQITERRILRTLWRMQVSEKVLRRYIVRAARHRDDWDEEGGRI